MPQWHTSCPFLGKINRQRLSDINAERERKGPMVLRALKLTMAALVVLGAQARADQTNVVQNLNIRLTGYQQGRTVETSRFKTPAINAVRVDSRRVIAALAAATGN